MNNEDVARVFQNIADLLAIKGESRYRIVAYERAAETLTGLGRDIKDVWQGGELKELPGVGDAIASKIDELLSTGELGYYDELTDEVPESLIEVLHISHVGPKKAALFWQELGVTTVEELEQAAAGELAALSGMGERSQQKILNAIEAYKRHQTGRVLLGQALPTAEEFLGRLRELPETVAAEGAGSLRRRRETVGDLDLLAASAEPAALMGAFLDFPEVEQVVGRGDTKSSVVLRDGLRIQLWVHPPERFGAALQYATGSKEHNVRLRELAQRNGLSLSEHGFKRESGEEILCSQEAEVYETLGLAWIPPELREDRGEIEAARDGRLPELIETGDILGDLHSHTDWSDGRATLEEMVRGAIDFGHRYLVVTDHSRSLGVANGLSIERLQQQRSAITELQENIGDGLLVMQGAEVEILADGSLDYPDEVLAELDLVVASLHTSLEQPRAKVTERLLNAVQNPHVDVIGHPTGRLLGRRDPADLDMEAVFQAAAESGVALEINASPERLDLMDAHARRAVELGCLLSIDTDAHHPEHFELLRYGIATARRGWVESDSVINTWSADRLRTWLQGRGD
ncbi:MAG: DNA polymerase/3'-5' exonuclease PolX [Anaerolineales bacterium]|nr:DNA polymerase/3'-5' exonuclease PolX [Anaerolineales bacterium]